MVQCTIDGGEKGRDSEIFNRNDKVRKRPGELSNRKLFLRGYSDKI
jgi:hypothetical protein